MKYAICSLALLILAVPLAAQQPAQKLIILGFDGADAKLTEQWMDEGKLPNLAKLRAQGTFSPLRPTIPSQTPGLLVHLRDRPESGAARHLRLPEAQPRGLTSRLSRRRKRARRSSSSARTTAG